MALQEYTGKGFLFPNWLDDIAHWQPTVGQSAVLDAVGEKIMFTGHIYIYGRPGGTKTISAAGGGKLHFLPGGGSITWATSGSTLRVGLQDTDVTGPPVRGDGTFDVYGDLVQGTDTITAATWKTVTMGSGTKSIAHGDLITMVMEMTVVNGSDGITVGNLATGNAAGRACVTSYTGGTYNATSSVPICLIEFDDGTLAILDGGVCYSAVNTLGWSNSSNPDERGTIFQVEDDVKIDGVWGILGMQGADGDFTLKLYSDPLGTPTLLWSTNVLAEQLMQTFTYRRVFVPIPVGSEIALKKNTNYWLTIRATGTGSVALLEFSFPNSDYRKFFSNGLNLSKGTRDNDSGAASQTTTLIPTLGVRISHRDVPDYGTMATMPHPGFFFPGYLSTVNTYQGFPAGGAGTTLNAAGEKLAMIGRVYIDGRPTSAKTLSAAGGGSIGWRPVGVTWADGSTTLDIGIQGVSTSAGPMPQPDGTYVVKVTRTGGDASIVGSSWNTHAMSGGSGSTNITHGDLIAVVWDMTARGGTDSVVISGMNNSLFALPINNTNIDGAGWLTTANNPDSPRCIITFDDGTIATLDQVYPLNTNTTNTFSNSTNPDERGTIFQVPFNCYIDAIYAGGLGVTDADSDYTMTIYSNPTGTPIAMATVNVLAEQGIKPTTDRLLVIPLSTELQLSRNTDYCVAVKATGTSNVRLQSVTLGAANYRALLPGGLSMKGATRNDGSGSFTEDTTNLYFCGVRVSRVDLGRVLGKANFGIGF